MSENGTGLELLGFLGGTAKSKEAEAQKKLDQYGYLMEKGELLTDIRFTQEIKEKGLQAYDGDVQLIMPTEESTLYKGIFGSTYLLERCYNVKITKVDRETMTVYLSYRAAQAEYRPAALEKIKKSIESGEELEVKAIVVLCRELQNYIVVDLLGLSIPGVLPFSEWIHGYAANIKEQAVSGKIIDVKIKGYTTKVYRGRAAVSCFQKRLCRSPNGSVSRNVSLCIATLSLSVWRCRGRTGSAKFRESPISLYTVFIRTVYLRQLADRSSSRLAGSIPALWQPLMRRNVYSVPG